MGNHGNAFSGRARVGFEPTFCRMHRIRFAEFPYLKVTARFFASWCPDEKLRVQQESKVYRNWKQSFYDTRKTYRGNSFSAENL
jgi:hypothetical protein